MADKKMTKEQYMKRTSGKGKRPLWMDVFEVLAKTPTMSEHELYKQVWKAEPKDEDAMKNNLASQLSYARKKVPCEILKNDNSVTLTSYWDKEKDEPVYL